MWPAPGLDVAFADVTSIVQPIEETAAQSSILAGAAVFEAAEPVSVPRRRST